jgi:hypothetical protein
MGETTRTPKNLVKILGRGQHNYRRVATAFRVKYWWRQQCNQISNGCLEIFKKIITLPSVTVLFLFTFFNLILDSPRKFKLVNCICRLINVFLCYILGRLTLQLKEQLHEMFSPCLYVRKWTLLDRLIYGRSLGPFVPESLGSQWEENTYDIWPMTEENL